MKTVRVEYSADGIIFESRDFSNAVFDISTGGALSIFDGPDTYQGELPIAAFGAGYWKHVYFLEEEEFGEVTTIGLEAS